MMVSKIENSPYAVLAQYENRTAVDAYLQYYTVHDNDNKNNISFNVAKTVGSTKDASLSQSMDLWLSQYWTRLALNKIELDKADTF